MGRGEEGDGESEIAGEGEGGGKEGKGGRGKTDGTPLGTRTKTLHSLGQQAGVRCN